METDRQQARREAHRSLIEDEKSAVAEIDAAISAIRREIEAYALGRQAEIDELRALRRESFALIRVIEPEFGKRKHRQRRMGPDPVKNRRKRKQQLLDWLRSHASDPDLSVNGFTVTGICNRRLRAGDQSVPVMNRQLMRLAFDDLADDGVIRLDRIGTGRAKIYKLVSANGKG